MKNKNEMIDSMSEFQKKSYAEQGENNDSYIFGEGGEAAARKKKPLRGICFCCTVLRVSSHRKKRWGL